MSEPQKYRKKPVVIEAMQTATAKDDYTMDDERHNELVANWIEDHGGHVESFGCNFLYIETIEGEMLAGPGDYVIKGVQGEFYPCKPDIFEATYEAAEVQS